MVASRSTNIVFVGLVICLLGLGCKSKKENNFRQVRKAPAPIIVKDLIRELDSRRISLDSAFGAGVSSGDSVVAFLVSHSSGDVEIDIQLSRPLFLVNSGSGQNMVAIQVYLGDGSYHSTGQESYITLRPNVRTRVRMVAFCVDFEKENPSSSERFSVGLLPEKLETVIAKIQAYAITHPDVDITCAAQASIWLAQGATLPSIRERFPFNSDDESLAKKFVD